MSKYQDPAQFVNPTGQSCEVASRDICTARSRLSPSMQRALQIRVDGLSAEQREAAEEIERLYHCAEALTCEVLERQQQLRQLREILLLRGAV